MRQIHRQARHEALSKQEQLDVEIELADSGVKLKPGQAVRVELSVPDDKREGAR